MTRRPPISTLFPYTTLSRSGGADRVNRFRLFAAAPHPPAYGPGTHGDARDFERGAGDPGEWHVETRSEEHTSELQSQSNLVCRLLLEKKKKKSALKIICHTT